MSTHCIDTIDDSETSSATVEPHAIQPNVNVKMDDHTQPAQSDAAATEEQNNEQFMQLLGKLPTEIGTLLIGVGIAGVLLPGPIGTPMLLAGAVVVWPKTFAPLERSFAKCCPQLHRAGVQQVKRFVNDLNRRFPE